MNETDTNATTIETQDPHPGWWTEHRRLAAEHDNRYLVRGEEADAEAERRYRRLGELEDLLRNTPVTTFEGCHVQLMALALAIEDGLGHEYVKGALRNLNSFMNEVEHALERHRLKKEVQRWCWEVRVPSEPPWADHPGTPADAEEIWRALNPTPGRGAHGGIKGAKRSRRGEEKAALEPASPPS